MEWGHAKGMWGLRSQVSLEMLTENELHRTFCL